MTRIPLAELSMSTLDGRVVRLKEIVQRPTLLIFLRHLA